MRKSPLMKIWDGDTIVDLAWSCTTASDSTPNQEEKEFMRIFTEHKKLTTDRDALIKVAEYAVRFLDPKEVDVEWMKAAIAKAKEK